MGSFTTLQIASGQFSRGLVKVRERETNERTKGFLTKRGRQILAGAVGTKQKTGSNHAYFQRYQATIVRKKKRKIKIEQCMAFSVQMEGQFSLNYAN